MKNVFIITTIKIYKGNSAGAVRMMNIAKALALKGVRVYLCSSALGKNIRQNNLYELSRNIFLVGNKKKELRGVLNWILNKFFKIFLAAIYLQKIINLAKHVDGYKVFYLYPTTEVSMDFMGLVIIKKLNKYKLFYDVNELRRAGLHNRVFSQNILKKFYEMFSYITDYIKFHIVEILTKYYDGLIVISTNIENYFKKYNKNIIRIPILSDVLENSFSETADYINGKKFLICFTGMITLKKEGFDLFYKALSLVKSKFENFELHLYGPISNKEKKLLLDDLPSEYGIEDNIIYHGIVEHSTLLERMRENHLLILPRPLNLQTKYGFSTKLSEYLVSGIPVFVTDVSDNSLYIKDGYNGFIIEPGNYKKMAEKIIYIISNYESTKDTVGMNAYITARKCFNYANYGERIYNFLFGKGEII